MGRDRTCSRGCSPAARIASPSRATCSTASTSSDIAQAIDAAFARQADGVFNVTDDEPAAYSDQVLLAAKLLGIDPPPELSMEEARADLTPLALSFYAGCVRVKNDKLKTALGVRLRYPTYREGLRALFDRRRLRQPAIPSGESPRTRTPPPPRSAARCPPAATAGDRRP